MAHMEVPRNKPILFLASFLSATFLLWSLISIKDRLASKKSHPMSSDLSGITVSVNILAIKLQRIDHLFKKHLKTSVTYAALSFWLSTEYDLLSAINQQFNEWNA